jgi:hypothetical protein
MLLVLVQVKSLLDLVSQALAIWGAAVSTILLLVNISSTTTACVEFFLGIAYRNLGHVVNWTAAVGVDLRPKARGSAYVASTASTSRELAVGGFSLRAFASDAPIRIDGVIVADVASTCTWSAGSKWQPKVRLYLHGLLRRLA